MHIEQLIHTSFTEMGRIINKHKEEIERQNANSRRRLYMILNQNLKPSKLSSYSLKTRIS